MSATNPADALSTSGDPQQRFLALITRITQAGAAESPGDKGGGAVPRPEDLLSGGPATPRHGPGRTPPGVANGDGDIPVPRPSDFPEPPPSTPGPVGPGPAEEVPLTAVDACAGAEHAKRIREAFRTGGASTFEAMRTTLTGLDYPVSRIHRTSDRAGAPLVRLDLRFMGDNLALEITGTTGGASVEAFGVSEREDVQVTDVRRDP
ncbi:hypothetical protein BX265_0291 [Streptomyces sp. TLI_235]|nr:hypothetical protein BX265_0291 [Streptomyces sp. TLI_235]